MDKIWKVKKADQNIIHSLKEELNISPVLARVLANRGLETPRQVEEFLDFNLEDLNDPFALKGMKESVNRIIEAIKGKEKIFVYGDYDVDGISSTSLLINALRELGADIDFYIPNRLKEGYGINKEAIKKINDRGADLIISVDCGISAKKEIDLANSLEIEVIITDHHTPPEDLPKALAIINPHQEGCGYPFKKLAGVGVAFKLVHGIFNTFYGEDTRSRLLKYIGLVALGTIADIVPLLGENRVIVKYGLDRINSNKGYYDFNIGILKDKIGYKDKDISAGQIGYYLTPCINAAGRLGKAELGVELLTTDNLLEAGDLASRLREMNVKRQEITDRILLEAEEYIESDIDLDKEWVLVIILEDGHPGVIGNAASKIQEKYHRPVVLITFAEGGIALGSARSINRFNIYNAFQYCEDCFESFGGHKEAAGCSLQKEDISKLRKKINQYAHKVLTRDDLKARIGVDLLIEAEEASLDLIRELEVLEPFGFANPRPKFMFDGLKIKDFNTFGREGDHLKVKFLKEGGHLEGIAWRRADLASTLVLKDKGINVVANLDINSFGGRDRANLTIKDIQFPSVDPLQPFKDEDIGLRVIDRRNCSNKLDYIKKLLERKEQLLIYTNSSKKSIELTDILQKSISEDKRSIASYNSKVSVEGRKSLREEFIEAKVKVLIVSNIILADSVSLPFNHLILYNLNFNLKEFSQVVKFAKENKSFSLHLIYGKEDVEDNIEVLNNKVPNRDILAKIYIGLKKFSKEDILKLDEALIAGWINSSSNLNLNGETILAGTEILKELNLLTIDKGKDNEKIIRLLPKPSSKLDLKESMRYNVGVEEKEAFERFKKIGLYQKADSLLELIKEID
ncbi:single-stranded-DNA-specific exonuclease RecJ [Halonatronum saccharophilum]|uniref:single-stranded-DNA-specific exonuclease RecJ n=1 Tax=Halonatronum saccharophilum TaxID=150060 RepID=UPI000481AFC1|nr:single-stranded-DNA-specific exonuclease RecJ [Halonatronum saccharophilum]